MIFDSTIDLTNGLCSLLLLIAGIVLGSLLEKAFGE